MAYLDLGGARVDHLDNGLTLIVLEDHSSPVVSVQMLYRIGAKNETAGATGLAHFLEHMAFRDSENFPDSQLVSSIYAVGGEWHGYTWLDQTTYFATTPRENLDLLLRIEADRMARLDISPADVLVERGAVITEMHSYENDPGSVLQDNVMYITFLAHPYRNNTIGWESDVARMSHADAVEFYQRHYHPGNAVLAVVGDVAAAEVLQQVRQYFGAIPGKAATPEPHTIEPKQTGERRITLHGEVDRQYFKIVYQAPGASNPDYVAFLLAQELLAGGSGVSFLQNDWGTPVRATAPLARVTADLTTWFPPSTQDYVFAISGSVAAGASESEVEAAIEQGIADLRSHLVEDDDPMAAALEQAKARVLKELVFDVQTTEDAAHQLAFFDGLHALDVLLSLPATVPQVKTSDVARVIDRYLDSSDRNIAWYVPNTSQPADPALEAPPVDRDAWNLAGELANQSAPLPLSAPITQIDTAPGPTNRPANQPTTTQLSQGLPAIVQHSQLSATVSLRVITPLAEFPAGTPAHQHQPAWGFSSLVYDVVPQELGLAISQARTALASAVSAPASPEPDGHDPTAMLEHYFSEVLELEAGQAPVPLAPVLLIVTGDIDPAHALQQLENGFGTLKPATVSTPAGRQTRQSMNIESTLPITVAQEQLGYVVRAPAPGQPDAAAWQMALYILSHGYEGRLGKEAISNRGLIYYIDSAYQTDGRNGWITLGIGVDPDKLPAMKLLLRETLNGLLTQPPSQQEVDEARQHLLGRYISAAQSNPELADNLARQWFWFGRTLTYQEFQQRLDSVTRPEVIALLPAFTHGTIVAIRNSP